MTFNGSPYVQVVGYIPRSLRFREAEHKGLLSGQYSYCHPATADGSVKRESRRNLFLWFWPFSGSESSLGPVPVLRYTRYRDIFSLFVGS